MDIKDFFNGMFSNKPKNVLQTPYGNFNLAKGKDIKRVQKMVIDLQRTTDALTRKDIKNWRDAWQYAINVDSPSRQRLYDIYRDAEIDLHLSGCVEQRRGFVMARSFKIVDMKGDENEEAVHFFDQSWFKQLMRYALDSIYWGHSLIELGDLCTDGDGCICYSDVKLIPRKHVIPEYGRVITDLGQDWTTGIDYRQPPFSDWLIEAGRPDDLGLYLKAASQTIPKKNMLAFWDTFGEIFGMPMRIARTTSRDQKEIDRLDKMLREAGTALSMVAGMETEIEFVESGKGDAFNVYDKRIDRANSELSKLIIGQTMTIEDGSSLSQSETHLEVFQNLVESDCDMLRDIVNNQLIPRMVRHGFPVKGLRFDWDYSIDYTPEQQKAYEEMVLQHYKVKPQYFEEKYGIPCEEKEPKEEPDPTEPKKKKDGKPAETLSRFFRLSPDDYSGLHQRYAHLLGKQKLCLSMEDEAKLMRDKLTERFDRMMKVLFRQEGANLEIGILASEEAQDFIEAHSSVLNGSFRKVEMSETMRKRLERSNYVFSGLKTFHELNEAFPSLLDENGNRKTFERFLNDVRKIDETYNSNYLRAEFTFVQASAEMAAKWERFMQDGDRYYLQYRTAGDAKVRPTHAEMAGITLPASDPFWAEFYPPNGWGCRCSVVQVRKSKYPPTDHEEAMARGKSALEVDKKGMFRFNAGMEQKTMPDYNPYTIKRCKDCDMNNGNMKLVFVPENELCAACKLVRTLANADAKQIKKQAKPLQGTVITNNEFPFPVNISKRTLQEWTNQPYKFYHEKNLMLLDIKNVFAKAKYLGTADNHKGIPHLIQSHIFEIEVRGEKALIIVREYDWHEYTLHSLSEGGELYKHIKKKE